MWCIPPKENAEFVCCMEDVLEVYTRVFDIKHPVVCMDETSKQLIKETRKPILSGPGTIHKHRFSQNDKRHLKKYKLDLKTLVL